MQAAPTESKFKTYYELTKPKIWYLLVFTALGTAVTASNIYSIEISIGTWIQKNVIILSIVYSALME